MAKAKEYTTYPFPYFKLPVTLNVALVQPVVDEKFKWASQFEGKPQSRHFWEEFRDAASRIAKQEGSSGWKVQRDKIQEIVDLCYPSVKADLEITAAPANTLHPQQRKLSRERAAERWNLSPDVADQLIERAIRDLGIRIIIAEKTFDQPQSVSKLHAASLVGAVRLSWSPPGVCSGIVIRRRGPNETAFRDLPPLGPTVTQKDDPDVTAGDRYAYEVGTLVSGSPTPGAFLAIEGLPRGVVSSFEVKPQVVGQTEGSVVLTWTNPANVADVQVLRSPRPLPPVTDNEGRMTALPTEVTAIPCGRDQSFHDKGHKPGASLYYQVAVRHPTGVYSVSEQKSVRLPVPPPPPPPPPPAPTGLVAESHLRTITVKWPPVRVSGEVVYLVVRSETANPSAPNANPKKWKQKSNTFEDTDIEPGVSYWYTVVTMIDERRGDDRASCGPIVARGEVSDLKCTAGSESIRLSWTPPKRAVAVQVRRGTRQHPDPPSAPADRAGGDSLRSFDREHELYDENLQNGTTYYYRVSCVFRGADGQEIVTRGDVCDATPVSPPVAVTDVSIARAPQGVEVRWAAAPPAGIVEVVRSSVSPSKPVGAIVPRSEIAAGGILLTNAGSTRAVDSHPVDTHPHYVVYSSRGSQSLLCGVCTRVEIADATVEPQGRTARLDWTWPSQCHLVRLELTRKGDRNNVLQKIECPRAPGGGDRGRHTISLPEAGEYDVRFLCESSAPAGQSVCGPGKTMSFRVGDAQQISWSLKKGLKIPFFGGKGPAATLRIAAPAAIHGVKSFVLIGKEADVPRSVSDGVPLATIDVADPDKLAWEGPVQQPAKAFGAVDIGEVHCKLFADPEGSVRIDPPPRFEDRVLK